MRDFGPIEAAAAVGLALAVGWCGTMPPYRAQTMRPPPVSTDAPRVAPQIPGEAGLAAYHEAQRAHQDIVRDVKKLKRKLGVLGEE